jgi:C1A family cysteine protease
MPNPIRIKGLGWRPDLPDMRDFTFSVPTTRTVLPPVVSLRAKFPPLLDQGQLGSCTANAIASAYEYVGDRKGDTATPSRLFIYYYERYLEGSVNEDSGAMIRDGMKVVASYGAPPETLWPYDIDRFTEQPPEAAVRAGQDHQAIQYMRVSQSQQQLMTALAQGFPVVYGFTVYDSFESQAVTDSGIVPMPTSGENVLGGHAVCLVGYKTDSHGTVTFEVRNSWGNGWGDHGYFWMPSAYVVNRSLASDFWTIRKVEG